MGFPKAGITRIAVFGSLSWDLFFFEKVPYRDS